MQITVNIPESEILDVLTKVTNRALCDEVREPYQVISDAIRDGVAKAITEKLSKRWGDDLIDEIADRVAKAMSSR